MKIQGIKINTKTLINGLLVAGGLILSMSASATQPSVERAVKVYVLQQSQQLTHLMRVELKQAITAELSQFSVADSLSWESEALIQVASATPNSKGVSNSTNKKNNHTANQLTKKSTD